MAQGHGPRARISAYSLACLAVLACLQILVYCGTRPILPYLTLHILSGPVDALIPFSPPWIIVYLLSFPYWGVMGLWIFSEEKAYAYRIAASYALALLISFGFFLIWPGTMERPEVTGGGLFNALVRWVYSIDSPTNLCPSLHVMLSYYCFRGALGSRRIPGWYKAFAGVFCALVCCSVLLVKQHALIDVPSGVFVGELTLQCGRLLRLERIGFAIEKALIKHKSK